MKKVVIKMSRTTQRRSDDRSNGNNRKLKLKVVKKRTNRPDSKKDWRYNLRKAEGKGELWKGRRRSREQVSLYLNDSSHVGGHYCHGGAGYSKDDTFRHNVPYYKVKISDRSLHCLTFITTSIFSFCGSMLILCRTVNTVNNM